MKYLKKLNELLDSNEIFKNEKELKEILLKDKDFAKGEVHQALVNVGYDAWNDSTHGNWSYDDMIEYISKYGDMIVFATLFGAYNGQVCNGGHAQYFDNGYASSESRGTFGTYRNIDKHEEMIDLFKELDLINNLTEYGKQIYDLIRKFTLTLGDETDTCPECGGNGEIECPECDGRGVVECTVCGGTGENSENEDEYCNMCDGDGEVECSECYGNSYETCSECNGDGEVVVERDAPQTWRWDSLDSKWYDFNDNALEEFNNYLKTLTLDGEKIGDLIPVANSSQKYNI